MLDWFILLLFIAMTAVFVLSSREVYLYVSLVLGSLIEDIKNFFKRGK
tara:strand:+ start:361 stop:504 length:144 start_codon:yes stop_codon:yes gene_type:complete